MHSKKATKAAAEPAPPLYRLSWWRATEYQITDDGMIAPTPDAEIVPVDVWALYSHDGGQTVHSTLPHLALANLCPRVLWTVTSSRDKTSDATPLQPGWWIDRKTRTLFSDGDIRTPRTCPRATLLRKFKELREADIPSDGSVMVDEAGARDLWMIANVDREALRVWVSRHGLLGLLPHRYVSVTAGQGDARTSYARTIKGWVTASKHLGPLNDGAVGFNPLGHLEIVGLDEWHHHLAPPDATAPWPPRPSSREFFRNYRESVPKFMRAAMKVKDIIETLLTPPGDLAPLPEDGEITSGAQLNTVDWITRRSNLDTLLSMGVQLTTAPVDSGLHRLHQQFRCYSLLGALAVMVLAGASSRAGGWVIRCDYCRQLARRATPGAKFCSDAHRNAMNVRKSKARHI